uniref:GATOR complex protein NPRL3 n=1 Tax=Electrophorus electricus TaxID=8005 RepID=A0A4W4DTL3_ELEEL
MQKNSPISVILVSSGSRGNKLLFRYPFLKVSENTSSTTTKQRSPYVLSSMNDVTDDQDGDSRFSDIILATILATKSDMCGKKFELKIDNVRFIGHPTLLQPPHTIQVSKSDPSPKREMPTMILFSVVFALRANAEPSVISCMHTLSRRVAVALQHEERRCQYLTREAKLMLAVQDEVTAAAETDGTPQSPFRHILPKCKLARDLKEAYDSLCTTGVVRLHINSWLEVSFCLPHKIHHVGGKHIPPEALEHSLKAIRPYHALLLLDSEKALLAELPIDCSPALVRLIKICSATKNLQQLAQDADLALLQVFQIAAHLVYWGKAIIVYPLCENNVYMLSPHANIFCIWKPLLNDLRGIFAQPASGVLPGVSLFLCCRVVAQAQLIQMVVWMLQRRLLIQLHTYVCLLVPLSEEQAGPCDEELAVVGRTAARSLSTPAALSFGSPTSSDDMTLTSPSMDNSSAELLPGADSPLSKRMTETLLASLAEHERQAILSVPAAQNPEDLRMFARLLHYFRGHHHLEEIMYNENMRRSQLKTLFDKFHSVLVVTNHEDPIISLFQSPPE